MSSNKFNLFKILSILLVILILATGCNIKSYKKEKSQENTVYPIEEERIVWDEKKTMGFMDNIVVLFLKEGVKEKDVLKLFPEENPKVVGRFPGINQIQIKIKPRNQEKLDILVNDLMEKEEILYAHIDFVGFAGAESFKNSMKNLKNNESIPEYPYSQKPDNEWWYEAIGLNKAREILPKENFVKVGVVDDGFDSEHKDLNLEFLNKDYEKENVPEEHGTHVAGIIQQIMPNAKITVLDSYKIPGVEPLGHLNTQLQFMKYLVDLVEADVKVINYSMGTDTEDDDEMPMNIELSSISSLYIWALKHTGRDFLLVQSAGNLGIDAYRNGVFATLNSENCLGSQKIRKSIGVDREIDKAQKSVFDSIVIVGSSDMKNSSGRYELAEGSNYGDSVAIVAPGMDINSTIPGGYMIQAGTSQSVPIVSGTLAMIWSINKNLTSGEIKQIIVDSAIDEVLDENPNGPDDKIKTYPLINIYEAAKMAKEKFK